MLDHERITVREDEVVQPDGSRSRYVVVDDPVGAVIVVATDDAGRVVLVRQHRYPLDSFTWELPAGEVPPGIDPVEQARSELREETGIDAAVLRRVTALAPWPARVRRLTTVVAATGLDVSDVHAGGQGGDETIEAVALRTRGEIEQMLRDGAIVDAPTIAALHLVWLGS